MSKVNIEPFIFNDEVEEGIQLNTENLPGAIQEEVEIKEKEVNQEVVKAEEEKSTEDTTIEESQEEEKETNVDDNPLDFFNKKPEEDKGDNKETKAVSSEEVDYKAFTDFLIEKEIWKDFEGRNDLEYTEESFQALWKAQAENTAKEVINEQRSEFGQEANELFDFLKAGGSVEQFSANYGQQKDIEAIDIADESGQEDVIKEYYKSLDYPDSKIKKQIERLKDEGSEAFKEEAEFAKTKLVSAIKEEREAMVKEQEAIAQDRKLRAETFNKNVRSEFYKLPDLADREKKDLDKFAYEYKYQDDNGRKYSEFMVKMNEITQDPKKYAKYIKIIKNFDDIEDKKTVEKEVKKQTYNFLKKGSNPLEGADGQQPIKQKKDIPKGFQFK